MGFQRYSEDMKLLATRLALENVSLADINIHLRTHISPVSLFQWKRTFRATNSVIVDPATYLPIGRPHSLSDENLALLYDLVVERPAVYLDELQAEVFALTGLTVSRATISRELRNRLGLSLLITRAVHPNQSLEARTDFMWQVAGIPPEFLVFIDESGVVGRDAARTRSWAQRGGTTIRQPRHTERSRWTLLPAVSQEGMIACTVIEGPVRRIDVELYLRDDLLPRMNRYPAVNSVLIMDNARVHHGGRILELCRAAGILVIYLPAYSPDMNPIENAFHCTKSRLKREDRWLFEDDKAEYLHLLAARVMTRALMQPLISHAGYTTRHYWARYNEEANE